MITQRLIDILTQLIEIDTTNPPGNEAGMVRHLQILLEGSEMRVVEHGHGRSSLVALVGPIKKERPTLTFIGHMDTVPYTEENWDYPPLKATVHLDRLYGRGASDMKSGLACMILLAEWCLKNQDKMTANLKLVFTADEEADGIGMQDIIKQGLVASDEFLIVPEPTDLRVAYEEKGALWLRLKSFGKASHGSLPEEGSNAIDAVFHFKQRLFELIACDHRLLGSTTASLNLLQGGSKVNVVADYATAEIDVRYPPDVSDERLREAVSQSIEYVAQSGVKMEYEVLNFRPALCSPKKRLAGAIKEAYEHLQLSYEEFGVRYYTDLSSFASLENEYARSV